MGCCLQSQSTQVSSQRVPESAPSLLRLADGRAPRPKRGAERGRARERGWGTRRGRSRSARPRCYLSANNVATRGEHRDFWGFGGNRERGGGLRSGDHTGEPRPRPRPRPRRALPASRPHRGIRTAAPPIPHFQPLNSGPLPLPFRPHPRLRGAVALSQAHRRPHPRAAPPAYSLRVPHENTEARRPKNGSSRRWSEKERCGRRDLLSEAPC